MSKHLSSEAPSKPCLVGEEVTENRFLVQVLWKNVSCGGADQDSRISGEASADKAIHPPESGIRTEGKLASESWAMTKTVTCRLFPEKAEFQSLEGEKGGKLVREREYRLEIPDRDFEKLEGDASEEASLGEIIERRFFSVADLPESWKVEPTEE